jgi:hypothetical protein
VEVAVQAIRDLCLTSAVLLAACGPADPAVPVDDADAISAEAMDSMLATTPGEPAGAPVVVAAPAALERTSATLAELGYREGITLNGSTDQAILTLPVNPGRSADRLVLRVEPTPRMPDATLVLRQGDRILAQRLLTDTTREVSFPLGDVIIAEGHGIVSLASYVPGRDACEAPLFYRTAILPGSTAEYGGATTGGTAISGFFPPLLRRVVFYLPEQPSLDAAQAALDAAAFVARRYRGTGTTFAIAHLPPADSAIAEPSWDERALVWATDGPTRILAPEGGRGTVLAIASRTDARQLFTLATGDRMVPSREFAAAAVRRPLPAGDAVTFDALGLGTRTLTGNVIASTTYRFALADLGPAGSARGFRLVATHSALPPDAIGEVSVLLNGALVWSRAADGTAIDATITLPERLQERDNRLEVRFTLRIGEGECRLGTPIFTATVHGESSLLLGDRLPMPPSFDRFPAALVPAFSVLLEPRDRYRVELAATMVHAMQGTTTTPLEPFVVRDVAEIRGALLAVGTPTTAEQLEAPLSTDGFRLRDVNGRVWDEFRPTDSYGAMQAYERQGRDVLLLHHTGANGQPLADLLRETLAPYQWFGVHGDLALRGLAGPSTTLRVANSGWRIEPLDDGGPSRLARWRSGIFIAAAVVLLALLIWLYPRVVRRELDPTG